MDAQAELIAYLRQVVEEEECCVTCSEDNIFWEDGAWKLQLAGFLEPWPLGETVDEAKAKLKEYASMKFGSSSFEAPS
jgi:hypothetical protein